MRSQGLWATTALISTIAAAPAFAVTPQEVWESWQALSASYGQTLTTESVDDSGSVITVTGLKITQADEGVTVEATLDELTMTDNGDGTVAIAMSESFPVTMTATEGSTEPVNLSALISQPGIEITASGDAAAVKYDFNAPEVTFTLEDTNAEDDASVKVDAKVSEMVGSYLFAGQGEQKTLDSTFSAASVNLTAQIDEPAAPAEETEGTDEAAAPTGPTKANFTFGMADISGSTKGTILSPAMMGDFAAALSAGFSSEASFTAGATTYEFDIDENGEQTRMAGTGASSALKFAIDKENAQYSGSAKTVDMTVSGNTIPFPEVKVSYGEAAFNLLVPLAKTEEPRDFAFLTKLVDLTVSDDIWAMVDPNGTLPRDPATVIIDTKGTARVTADMTDPAAMEKLGTEVPAELHSLDVTELRASIAGAELTGSGAFTFDNTDLTTFGGVPAPTGKLDLKLTGGNGLMDKLVALGLVAEDEVMGVRMMLSMFANAAPEGDELTSTLEFKDKGFFANGQRLQ